MMEEHVNETDHAVHRVGHVVPLKMLFGVFAALVVLTIVTVAASKVDLGEYNLVIALLIAVSKASLVVLFFMHMRWDKPFNGIVFVGCLIFVGLFIGLTLLDTMQYQGSKIHQEAKGVDHVPLRGGD
jgi:cytochrome c oxidase subunit IV